MSFILVYTTYADERSATKVSNFLIQQKLVACSNIFPIKSAYWWQGAVQNEDEYVGIVKTISENWLAVQKAIAENHPYEVPCIMKFEVEANASYEQWIRESVVLQVD